MTAPVSAGSPGGDTAAPNKRGNRLAVASFMLALAAPIVVTLSFVTLNFILPHAAPLRPVVGWAVIILYVVGLLAGLTAVVSAVVALFRARRYPPEQRRLWWAVIALLISPIVTIGYALPYGFVVTLVYSCVINTCTFFRG